MGRPAIVGGVYIVAPQRNSDLQGSCSLASRCSLSDKSEQISPIFDNLKVSLLGVIRKGSALKGQTVIMLKQKHWLTDRCSCKSRCQQMWNNVKGPPNFTAPTRGKIADSSSKTPDAIIREHKAAYAGGYIERNVRLALTCDYNAL
jgi:hypothetical protein